MYDGMIETFRAGGIVMWPLLAIAIGILVQAARAGIALRSPGQISPADQRRTAGVLFWGCMALVLGLIGTFVGIAHVAAAVQSAGGVSASLAWGGVGVSLIPTIFALMVLFVAGVLWFLLRGALRRVAPA